MLANRVSRAHVAARQLFSVPISFINYTRAFGFLAKIETRILFRKLFRLNFLNESRCRDTTSFLFIYLFVSRTRARCSQTQFARFTESFFSFCFVSTCSVLQRSLDAAQAFPWQRVSIIGSRENTRLLY